MRRYLIPLALGITVLVSGILSWMLLTNPDFLYGGGRQEVPQQTVREQEVASLSKEVAGLKLSDVLAPIALDAYDGTQYWEASDDKQQTLVQALAQEPSELGGDFSVIQSPPTYASLSTSPRLILRFADQLPVSLWSQWFKAKEGPPLDFNADQIWLLQGEPEALYLVNQVDETFVRVPVANQDLTALYQQVAPDFEGWTPMTQVTLAKGKTLIATEGVQLQSQVYTLKKEPEANLIGLFFGTNNYSITDSSDSGERKYKTFDLELDINSESHVFTARSEAVQNRNAQQRDQTIMDSFTEMKKFGTWNQGLRLTTNMTTNTLYYQRYLEGYAVMSDASPYYAGLQFNLSSKVTRFSGSLLTLRSHITDRSKDFDLVSADTLINQLQAQGLRTTDLDRLFVAYEWQANMENFQLVTFEPKYYIEYKGRFISMDRVNQGELRHDQESGPLDEGLGESASSLSEEETSGGER